MSIRSDRIKLLVEQSGKSYQELEVATGIKKSSLQRYASGITAKIPLDVIEILSKYFNVPQTYLMGWDEEEKPLAEPKLNEGEKMLLELFRRVPEDKQELVLKMIALALDTPRQ
jgi:transcriptional regulator with XRE-family HTH domain